MGFIMNKEQIIALSRFSNQYFFKESSFLGFLIILIFGSAALSYSFYLWATVNIIAFFTVNIISVLIIVLYWKNIYPWFRSVETEHKRFDLINNLSAITSYEVINEYKNLKIEDIVLLEKSQTIDQNILGQWVIVIFSNKNELSRVKIDNKMYDFLSKYYDSNVLNLYDFKTTIG